MPARAGKRLQEPLHRALPAQRDPALGKGIARDEPQRDSGRDDEGAVDHVEWSSILLGTLRRAVQRTADPELASLLNEIEHYPNVQATLDPEAEPCVPVSPRPPALLVPCVLRLPAGRVSLFTTLTTFGTPRDITLDELSIELFYPADEGSRALLTGLGVTSAGPVAQQPERT